jgi:3-hydroxy-D-aspartate aldolase
MNLPAEKLDNAIGKPIGEIDTPALLIDVEALRHNIRTMHGLVAGTARLRPHCKSHKSARVVGMQIAAGAHGACCAKLGEAEAVVRDGGLADVMVTTPIVGRAKLERLARLARSVKTTVTLDNEQAIEGLSQAAQQASRSIDVVVEVDVGQGRCGVPPGAAAPALVRQLARYPLLRFRGLQGYQGKLQMLGSFVERHAAVKSALDLLLETAMQVRRAGYDVEVLTGGGTGSLPIDLELGGLNELQPGSYVFMDANYRKIEWDSAAHPPPFRCSLTVLGSVISCPSPDRAVIDVGWKSASSDSGIPVPLNSDLTFEFAGDEHAIVRRSNGGALGLPLGARVQLVPSHCDTTVNLFSEYHLIEDGMVTAVWPVDGRGRSQ